MRPTPKVPSSFSPWPLGIFLFFVILAAVNFYLFWIANQSPHQLVVEDYYDNAIKYDKMIEAQTETEKRGWQVALVHEQREHHSLLQITLKDSAKNLIPKQTGTINLYRPSDLSKDVQTKLSEVAPGVYQTELSALASGLWEVRVLFKGDNQNPLFYQKIRLHI
ncbi:MAG: FixH family protein [SAR324 cluster bacterium]|nr:FixH family protein [SAR324 cluster bacterium]